MSSQFSSSSTTTTTTDHSRSTTPDIHPSSPLHPLEEDLPDPEAPSSPKHTLIASPPLDTRPYSPHGVGIGILSPQPVLGPFAPISRASYSPLQVKSSPVEQRSNPLESVSIPRRPTSPFEPLVLRASGSRSPEIPQPSPPSLPAPRHVDDASASDGNPGELIPLTTFSSAGTGQVGLCIAIPPPNPASSTSTPSPPLLAQPTHDPVASTVASILGPGPSGPVVDSTFPASTVDLLAPSADLNIDFTELDTEGYSALEKIYLFSRSRASFHRVFIAHALPGYLLGAETSAAESASREIIEQITPSEAVEYVLPLLNGLAMDEDEAVKEALAAELVPIIWWFITHCKVVEDDPTLPPSPPAPTPLSSTPSTGHERDLSFHIHQQITERPDVLSHAQDAAESSGDMSDADGQVDAPTFVPVQAFTPILGTLLLSPNGIVGGSARYAVVELLRRIKHADEREDGLTDGMMDSAEGMRLMGRSSSPTPSQIEYQDSTDTLDVGLFGRYERRLFERELLYQVVIGMGRLDMDEGRADIHMEDASEFTTDSGTTTAVATPQPTVPTAADYFPTTARPEWARNPSSTSTVPVVTSPLAVTADMVASGSSAVSPSPSPSPPVSSTSSLSGSPGHSYASTPSLTSSTSSTSGEFLDNAEGSEPDRFSIQLAGYIPATRPDEPMDEDEIGGPEAKSPTAPAWVPPGPLTGHLALPTTPPFEVPPQHLVAPVPVPADSNLSIGGLSLLQGQPPPVSPARENAPRQVGGWMSPRSAANELEGMDELQHVDDGSDLSEEASVGRLSSMSLMAAVTASGSIGEETKMAFVAEVERVGRDPVYWVRREASFAVGALAKVVPVEVVTSSLLPLFESLCHDPTWHVRHSVLFALPAILSRLSPGHRRQLALDVILPLSQDEQATVRSAVLEALGEVMYTFVDDEGGPPDQLLKLFLGIRETDDPGGGNTENPSGERCSPPDSQTGPPPSATSTHTTSSAWSDYGTDGGSGPDIYDDPQRPLVCAFNYPAVTLTLGRERWPELRPLYLSLAQDSSFKIRRTLAASLGEIAKIIGEEHARADLMDVFWSSLRAEESEVRMKAIEALQTFVEAIGRPQRVEVVNGLEEAVSSGKLHSWREREAAAKTLGGLVEVDGIDGDVLRRLLVKGLDDRVAAVREAAVMVLPAFVKAWRESRTLIESLQADVRAFASSSAFRKRTVWLTCIQELLINDQGDVVVRDGPFWETLSGLVGDPIVDVRIRAARLLSLIFDKFGRDDNEIGAKTVALARGLTQDDSHEVQAFATAVVAGGTSQHPRSDRAPSAAGAFPTRMEKSAATFSRPPPPSPS